MSILVRDAIVDDVRTVAEIHVRSWQEAYAPILPAKYLASLSVDRCTSLWLKVLASAESHLYVAEVDGAIQGFLSIRPNQNRQAERAAIEVTAFYVLRRFWGHGVGRELWLYAKGAILRLGSRSCDLWVFQKNDRAIRFYRKAGFVADESSVKSLEVDGRLYPEARYVCALGD
jgi:GNAT superfamily N-acetyltransferase